MVTKPAPSTNNDQVIHVRLSWDAYKALSAGIDEDGSPRLIYNGETLEIMSPGSKHERIVARIADLLTGIVTAWDINIESTRSTTFEAQPRAFEGDGSYYIASAAKVRDWDNVNLATDPPPDLVIEVDLSRRRFDKKPLYAGIGIPEFWRYDGESGFEAFGLIDGAYAPLTISRVIPGLPLVEIGKRVGRRSDRLSLLNEWAQWLGANRERLTR